MRPGGLTALAVFNFISAAMAGLRGLGALAAHGQLKRHAGAGDLPSAGVMYALAAFELVVAVALFVSGLGYLRRARFTGYVIGLVYVVLSLASSVAMLALDPGGFTSVNLVGFVYPLITLFLLTVIFRKDFA